MGDANNPFGGGTQYAANVQFGSDNRDRAPQKAFGLEPEAVERGGAAVKDTTTAGFAADVIQESRRQTVLVDFWAPWCGPCKQLTPVLEKAVREAGGKVKLVKMNIDEHPSIAGQLGIQSIPAVIAFKDGRPVDGFMGALTESQVREFIQRVAGGDGGKGQVDDALAAALEARAQGDIQMAAQIYSAVLEHDPGQVDAIAGLADVLFEAGDAAQAREVLERTPADKQEAAAITAVRAKLALAEQVGSLESAEELLTRLDADPQDHQARFDLAMIRNAQGKREEAADNLLAIMKADRSWKDDAARTQLLQFFEAWGSNDEATVKSRRKLSSLLFS
jgi:putative thioredoxin